MSAPDQISLQDIRQKLLTHSSEYFDLKLQVGGLVDVEFAVQIALLKRAQFSLDSSTQGMIQYLMEQDKVWESNGKKLIDNYNFLRMVEQMHQLTSAQSQTKFKKNSPEVHILAANLNVSQLTLIERLEELFLINSQLLMQIRGES